MFRRLLSAVLLVAALQGCQRGTEAEHAPRFANWPEALQDFRFRWNAAPGIDLVSGPAVPLRAYLESYRLIGLTSDATAAYPGFDRAVPERQNAQTGTVGAELVNVRPVVEAQPFGPPAPFYGNEYFHVLEVTPIDGSGYRAYVCDGMYNVFRKDDKAGKLVSVARYGPGSGRILKVWRVELTDASAVPKPASPETPQSGPNPAPIGDVFGHWRITGASDERWGTLLNPQFTADETVGGARRLSACADRMPHDYDERAKISKTNPDTAPTAGPAVPGWPSSSP